MAIRRGGYQRIAFSIIFAVIATGDLMRLEYGLFEMGLTVPIINGIGLETPYLAEVDWLAAFVVLHKKFVHIAPPVKLIADEHSGEEASALFLGKIGIEDEASFKIV